jgi:hypothetical protein
VGIRNNRPRDLIGQRLGVFRRGNKGHGNMFPHLSITKYTYSLLWAFTTIYYSLGPTQTLGWNNQECRGKLKYRFIYLRCSGGFLLRID